MPSFEQSGSSGMSKLADLLLTFLAGFLLFLAMGLLAEHEQAASERPASTVYGVF